MADVTKRRGRKSKNAIVETEESSVTEIAHVPKKRGRKPKGGKIVQHSFDLNDIVEPSPNIILHLKCSLKDIETIANDQIKTHDCEFMLNKNTEFNPQSLNNPSLAVECNTATTCKPQELNYSDSQKNTYDKVRELEKLLHFNNVSNKKSACFWCTHDFDNPPIYIPKFKIKGSYHVYGCFCSPECAAAHLMKEDIDTSSKFERYHLLNFLYAKVYGYKRNIKPAPNPHYTLSKFCGNLSIQEYRELLQNDNLLLIVDKPLTRILPELHEDNDDFLLNNKAIPSNTCLRPKRSKAPVTKNEIMNENFGFA
ncbi:MAG: hypothetical protein ACXABD_00935 [Candidatus Thorarchaeota archaeon]|jgi:hypothetical protein